MTVFLIVITVLCIILLLPIRVKGSLGDGKFAVSVYYTFLRVFHKESAPEPPPPETPQQPNPDSDTPPQPDPEPEPEVKPKKKRKGKPKKPGKPAETPKPESVSEPVSPEGDDAAVSAAEADALAAELAGDAPAEPEKPKKKRGIRAFIARIKPHSFSDVIGLIQDGSASLSPSLRALTRHLHFRHVRLYLAVASDDPANTAQLYGRICAAAFNLLGALQCRFDIEADEFRILADFYNNKMTFRTSLELRCSPASLLLTVLILGGRFLWRTWRRFRREDKDEVLRGKETAPLAAAE